MTKALMAALLLAAPIAAQSPVGVCIGACPPGPFSFRQTSDRPPVHATWVFEQGDTLTTYVEVQPGGAAWAAISLDQEPSPYPLPFASGSVLVSSSANLGVFPMKIESQTMRVYALPIPVAPGLRGLNLFTQALRWEQGAGILTDYVWCVSIY